MAKGKISDQQPAHGRATHSFDHRAGALLQAVPFKQADHRQNDPCDSDVAIVIKGFAQRLYQSNKIEPGEHTSRQRRTHHHHQRIEPQRKTNNDDRNSKEWPIAH